MAREEHGLPKIINVAYSKEKALSKYAEGF
jgi:hypothetical protein